eukprot:2023561-Amphidinium_carterae.1
MSQANYNLSGADWMSCGSSFRFPQVFPVPELRASKGSAPAKNAGAATANEFRFKALMLPPEQPQQG